MGSFAIPSLSALGLWRRGSKTQGGEPGAPGRRLNTVARAAAPAMARSGQGTHGSHWWRAQFGSPARIREWAAQELTNGRLLPWFAVAYGAGVILYFTALAALFMNMSRYSGGQDNEFWLESWNGDHFNFERKNNATR